MSAILLIAAVPVIVIVTALYAVLAEVRHNRIRRTRWERRGAQVRALERALAQVSAGDR
jgi:hypothetical protein